ncbi:MAG: AAC(3) family N-acetyltransferase, partial [Pseudomonadales bacterium]
PAFNFGDDGEGARERLKREPRFDLRRTPSQMGLMTELFRRSRGVLQSRHPVYRIAALGPEAEAIVAGHELAPSGMGEETPFGYMARCNAHIVGIGKSFQVMTQVHQVETLMADQWPSPLGEMPNLKVTIVEKDTETEMEIGGAHQQWRFNIWKLRELMCPEQLREWRFHNCPMFAARAGEVTDTLVEAAKRGTILYDP